MAGVIYLLSNNTDVTLTPEKLRALAHQREPQEAQAEPPTYQVHRLEARLGAKQVGDLVRRYETGESARSLATEYDVAPSALIRLPEIEVSLSASKWSPQSKKR